ncbi:MAG TPA: hypothetical protein PKC21_07805 [Oligoflexia bacterium]|nr:hypothetical protein [Oligoflexia bacterium]HMR25242.1 hypothetical protein [Oligoflexia bacterium]
MKRNNNKQEFIATFIVAGLFSAFFLLFAKPNKANSKKPLNKDQPITQANLSSAGYSEAFKIQKTNLTLHPSQADIYKTNLNTPKHTSHSVRGSATTSFASSNHLFQPSLNETDSRTMNAAIQPKMVENALLNPMDSATANHLTDKQTFASEPKSSQEAPNSYAYIDPWDTSTAQQSQKNRQSKNKTFNPSPKPNKNASSNTIAFNSSKKALPVRTSLPYSIKTSSSSLEQNNPREMDTPQDEDENETPAYETAEKNNYTLKLEPGLCLEEHYLSNIKARLEGPPDYIPQEHTKAPERIQCIGFSGQLNVVFARDHVLLDKPGIDFILHIPVPSMKGPKKMANVYGIKEDKSYPLGQIIMGSNGSGSAGFDLAIYKLDSIDGIMVSDLEIVTDENVRQYCLTNSLPNAGFSIDAIELVHYFVQKNKRDGDT